MVRFHRPVRREARPLRGRLHRGGARAAASSLTAQLRQLRHQRLTTRAVRRLFPPPYGDDAERNAGYEQLVGTSCVERRWRRSTWSSARSTRPTS